DREGAATDKTSEDQIFAPARPAERTTLDPSRTSTAQAACRRRKHPRPIDRPDCSPLHQRIRDFKRRVVLLTPVLLPEISRQRVNISTKTRPDEPLGVAKVGAMSLGSI